MAGYRLYLLNREGRIRRALDLECDTDEDAVRRMDGHDHPFGMELWQHTRLVQSLEPATGGRRRQA